jgi:nicotinate phosphoribosyltransferase
VPLLRGGEPVGAAPPLEQGRQRLRDGLRSVPWEGLTLSRGEPAIPTVFLN